MSWLRVGHTTLRSSAITWRRNNDSRVNQLRGPLVGPSSGLGRRSGAAVTPLVWLTRVHLSSWKNLDSLTVTAGPLTAGSRKAGPEGLEPPTTGFGDRDSDQ